MDRYPYGQQFEQSPRSQASESAESQHARARDPRAQFPPFSMVSADMTSAAAAQNGSWAARSPSFAQFPHAQMGQFHPNQSGLWPQMYPGHTADSSYGAQFPQHASHDHALYNGQPNYSPDVMNYTLAQFQQAMAAAAGSPAFQQPNMIDPRRGWQLLAELAKTSPTVDYSLVNVLFMRFATKQTPRAALDTLEGVNNFTAPSWKEYYLENMDRINAKVQEALDNGGVAPPKPAPLPPIKAEKKPTPKSPPPALKTNGHNKKPAPIRKPKTIVLSPSPSSEEEEEESLPASPPRRIKRRRTTSTKSSSSSPAPVRVVTALPGKRASVGRRATMNSMSAEYQPEKKDYIIEPPSRSPTPPDVDSVPEEVRGKRSLTKFTEEDRQYTIRFLTYELHKDPDAGKGELADKIYEKAPHHPARSWQQFFNRDDLIEKIRRTVPSTEEDAEDSDADDD